MELFVLDLETTTNIESANKTRKELLFDEEATFICATMYAPISAEKPKIKEFYGKNNAENAILDLAEGIYYTWNGARFDTHYIYHLLRKAGYSIQVNTRKNESRKKQLKKWEFNYLLSGSKLITLSFRNENGLIEIRDACLLFTCSLANFIKNTCPEYPKLVGQYDYRKFRILEEDFTEEEKEYCRYDIYGFSVGMHRIQKQFYDEFGIDILNSYTAGSFAMKYARRELGQEKIQEYFPNVTFDRNFVIGGRTYVNQKHRGKIIEGVTKIDANSFYPSIMVNSKLPYGKMKKIAMSSSQLKEFLLSHPDKYVFAHLIKGVVKYDDMFSPIVTHDEFNNRDYPTIAGSADNVYLDDNILRDKKFIHKNCVFMCYIFDSKIGILDYMKKPFELKNKFKKEGKAALELAVKIILNATYGKFIQRDIVPIYDFLDGIIVPTGEYTKLQGWYQYAPIGAAITANCRYILCKYMNILRDRFIYCDTDSLIFTGDVPKEIPLGIELGQWKVEASPSGIKVKDGKIRNVTGKSIFFQRKTYAMEIDGETHITFCGISNLSVNKKYPNGVTIEQLQHDMFGGIIFDVIQGNHTQNGVVLVERARMKKYTERY